MPNGHHCCTDCIPAAPAPAKTIEETYELLYTDSLRLIFGGLRFGDAMVWEKGVRLKAYELILDGVCDRGYKWVGAKEVKQCSWGKRYNKGNNLLVNYTYGLCCQ